MRSLWYLPVEIVTAFFFAASIGIGSGVVVISYTQRVGDGLKVALLGFLAAAVGFGYAIWRSYRPRLKPPLRGMAPVPAQVAR
jgi:hypothetical protein